MSLLPRAACYAALLLLPSACNTSSTFGGADLGGSRITLTPSTLPGDGLSVATVEILVARNDGTPVPHATVTLNAPSCVVVQPKQPTDAQGLVTGAVASHVVGAQTVSATIQVGEYIATLHQTAVVTFTAANLQAVPVAAPGQPIYITVTAPASLGGAAFTGTVSLSSSDPNATLPNLYTFTPADLGSHSFSGIVLSTPGDQVITVRDTSTGQIIATFTYNVQAGPVIALQIDSLPATTAAGSINSVQVRAVDGFGNLAAGYTGTVHFSSSDGRAVLPADTTFAPRDGGVATFNVVFESAGSQSLSVTDTAQSSLSSSVTTTVIPQGGVALKVTAEGPFVAGQPVVLDVQAVTAGGNIATDFAGALQFASSDGQVILPVNVTMQPSDNGTVQLNVTLKTAGSQSIAVSMPSYPGVTGALSGIAVAPAAFSTFRLGLLPTVVAGKGVGVSVAAVDAYGNIVPSYTGTLQPTSTDSRATLPTSTTLTAADAGQGALNGNAVFLTAGVQTLTVQDTSGNIRNQNTQVLPAAASTLEILPPGALIAGAPADMTVVALDPYGNVATGYAGTVELTSRDPNVVLPLAHTFNPNDAGVSTFSVTFFDTSATLSATDIGNPGLSVAANVTVTPAAATHVLISGVQNPSTAGVPSNLTLTLLDAYNQVASTYTGTLVLQSTDSAATFPVNVTFAAIDQGQKTLSQALTFFTGGVQSVSATDSAAPTITGSTGNITVHAGPATVLLVTGLPANSAAGSTSSVTVTAEDAYGNVATGYTGTIHFTSSDPQATLPANTSFTSANGGVYTLTNGVALKTAGSQMVTATDTVNAAITGGQAGVTIAAANAVSLAVTGVASGAAGNSSNMTVAAKDAYNNTVTSYTGTIHFTSSDPQATLPANTTFSAANAGVYTFTSGVTLRTGGNQSVTATDTINSSIMGTQSGIVVTSGNSVATFAVTGIVSGPAGTVSSVTVTAKDGYNNTATGYTGTIHFASGDGQATLPPNYAFTAANAGVYTATNGVALKTTGTQSVTVNDTANTFITGTQNGISVTAATASTLIVSGIASSAAGTASSALVTAKDAYGNVATGYTGTIHFTSSDPQAALPASYIFAVADSGAHTFSNAVMLKTAGNQSVTATDSATSTVTGTQSGINVAVAGATTLLVTGIAPTTAGMPSSVTVTAKDAYNNTASGYTGTVHFTSSDAQAGLPASYAFTAANGGSYTFSDGVTLKTSGAQSVTATDTVTSTIAGTQSGIAVSPAGAATLVVSGIASGTTAGLASNVTVTAKDSYNNTVTGYTGSIHFSSSDPQAGLPTSYTFTTGNAGAYTFTNGVTLKTAGSQSVTATDTVVSTITGTQSGVVIAPASVATLVVSGIASGAAGMASNVSVTAKDAYNNTATGYTGTIHFTSSDAQATLAANYTFTAANAGTHAFLNGVTLKTAGTQSVAATDTVLSSITGAQSGVAVTAGGAVALGVASIASTAAGTPSNVTVTAKDAYNNTAIGYTGTIHLSSSDAQATLPANYTFTAGNAGSNTFTGGVTLKTAGTQTVTATDTVAPTINGMQSGIVITPTGATALVISGIASGSSGNVSSVAVTAKDAYNNTATGYTGTVHFSSSDGQATLPANYTFTLANAGTNTFTGGVTLKTAGSQSVTATDTVTSTITGTQSGIAISPASGATLVVSGIASGTAGTVSSVTVTAKDAYNNTVTGYTGTVHFTSSDAQAALPANYTFTVANAGTYTLSNAVTLKTSGAQSVTATDTVTSTIAGTQSGIVVTSGNALTLIISGISSGSAGSGSSVTVTAKDAYNNTASGYIGTVHFTSSDAQASLPSNYTFTAGNAGSTTFSNGVTLKTSGTQSVTATDTVTSTITGTQNGIVITSASAVLLAVSGIASGVAGTASNATVTAKDAYNNIATGYTGTVHFTSSDGQATLPANYTFTVANAGVYTFSAGVTLKTIGTQSVTATDTVTSASGTQSGIVITPASAALFVVSGLSSGTAGAANNVTVTAKDAYNNTATNYTGSVHFTSSDAQASLPAPYTFTVANAGTCTFTNGVTLKTVGTQSVTATDTVTSTITGSQSGLAVAPGSAATLVVSGVASGTAGAASNITVAAKDAYNNTATGYTGIIHFTSSDGQASLPGNYTFTIANAGTYTFSNAVTLKTTGVQSVTATDTVTGTITGTQGGISVSPAVVSTLVVSGIASGTAGVASNVTVTAKDGYNNTATGYTGTIHFTSSDGQAALPGNYTFIGADAGMHTLVSGVTLKTAGTQTVTATDTVTSTITGRQNGISVTPAATSILVVSGVASGTAGVASTITVTAKDAYNNTATGYAGTVHFTSTDPQAALPGNYTFTVGNAGIYTLSNGVALKTSGSQSITATDTVTSTITGSQNGISVTSGSASTLGVSGIASGNAGTSSSVTITAKDSYNNTATGYVGTIHFTSSDAQATLPANYTFVGTDAGVRTFANGVTLKTAGTQSVTATDTVTSTIMGVESGINVAASGATALVVAGIVSGTAGSAQNVTVTAKDAYSNTATGYIGTIHFTSSDGQASVPGNYTFTGTDAGTHAFPSGVTFKTVGTQSVTATDTVTSTITGTQSGISVAAAVASTLVVSGIASGPAGVASNVTVTAKDAYNNTATGYTGTIQFTTSDGQASLPSSYTFTTANAGIYTFTSGVTLKTVGTQSVTATDAVTGTVTGTQSGISVTPTAAHTLVVSGIASGPAGVASSVSVTAKDAYNNVATGYVGTIHFTSSDGQASLPVNYTFTAANAGTYTFSNGLTLKTVGTQTVTATDTVTSTITGTQNGITVTSAASTLVVSGISSGAAGTTSNVTVTAKDSSNNTATGYTGTIHFTSSDGQASLPVDYTFTAANAGTYTFTSGVKLKTVGTQTVTATDTVTSTITGTQSGISVSAGTATTLTMTGLPGTMSAGQVSSVTVAAKDAYGNTATGYNGTVHFTSTDAQASLPTDSTLSSGSKTFSNAVTLKTTGTESVTATDTVVGSLTASESSVVSVGAVSASTSSIVASPSFLPANNSNTTTLTVTAEDAYGTKISGQSVTLSASGSGNTFSATSGNTNASGVFTATLKSSAWGGQTITATLGAVNVTTIVGFGCSTSMSFATQVTYSVGEVPEGVALGDVSGDGKADIIIGNNYTNTVSVLLNQGSGTFATQVTYAVGTSPYSVALGDVNGDGKLDIVASNYGSSNESVLLNQGSGTFATQVKYAVGSGPADVVLADVSGDGKLDMLVANYGANTLGVLLNNGNGTFAAMVTYAAGSVPNGVAVGDVNGDGKLDVVTANINSNNVSMFLNQGSGTFATQVSYAAGNQPTNVALSDVNVDGHLDIVVDANSTVGVLLNQGNGTFAAQISHTTGSTSAPEGLYTTDFNGDGYPDATVANYGGGTGTTVSVLLSQGAGTFGTPLIFAASQYPFGIASADLNGDGKPDIVASDWNNWEISVLLNTCQ